MDYVSALLTMKALDGLSARSVVTAQNIANAGTPNYQPLRLTFEDALRDAAQGGEAAIRAVQPRIESLPVTAQSDLRLDMELATASTTSMRYAALVDVLSRQLQIAELSVSKDG